MIKKINLLIAFLFLQGCLCQQQANYLRQKVKPVYYAGEVDHIFMDTADRMTPKIVFVDGSVIDMDVYELYDVLQPGDSLIKKAGTLKHELIRKGEAPRYFYPKCDGNEIK